MKYIVILILFTFSVIAQNEDNTIYPNNNESSKSAQKDKTDTENNSLKENKENNKNVPQETNKVTSNWELSLGSNHFNLNNKGEKGNGFNLGAYYRINSRFSIGYTHFHYSDYPMNKFHANFVNSDNVFLYQSKTDKSKEMGMFNFRFFLSGTIPFFLAVGVVRDFIGMKSSTIQYYSYYNGVNYNITPIFSRTDTVPITLLSGGIGFQKNYESGTLFGFSYTRLEDYNAKRNIHTESTSMLFIFSDGMFSKQSMMNLEIFSFWVGYAF